MRSLLALAVPLLAAVLVLSCTGSEQATELALQGTPEGGLVNYWNAMLDKDADGVVAWTLDRCSSDDAHIEALAMTMTLAGYRVERVGAKAAGIKRISNVSYLDDAHAIVFFTWQDGSDDSHTMVKEGGLPRPVVRPARTAIKEYGKSKDYQRDARRIRQMFRHQLAARGAGPARR